MFKKMMMLGMICVIATAPIMVSADTSGQAQMHAIAKTATTAAVIQLASNDAVHMQNTGARRTAEKDDMPAQSASPITKIPQQAWLILAALFCFVMRLSRGMV